MNEPKENSPQTSDDEIDIDTLDSTDLSLNILIIEDFEASSTIMSSSLRFCRSATCVVAKSGSEALELLRAGTNEFDVILSDVLMPEMNGIELIKRIREFEIATACSPHIIIAMSADEMFSDECMRAGATLFLHKHKKPMCGVFKVLDELRKSRRSSI